MQTETEKGVHQLLGPLNKDVVSRALAAAQGPSPAQQLGRLMTLAQVGGAVGPAGVPGELTSRQEYFDKYAIPACPHVRC